MNDLITTQKFNSVDQTVERAERRKRDKQLKHILEIEDNYSSHIIEYVNWCRENEYGIDDYSVKEYFVYLNGDAGYERGGVWHKYRANTINIKRAAVIARVRQLYENVPIDDQIRLDRVLSNLNKLPATKAPKVSSVAVGSDKVLSYAELETLISQAPTSLAHIINFLRATACRVSEMLDIRKAECELSYPNGNARVKILIHGKGSKERSVVVPRELYDSIDAHFHGSVFLFETEKGEQYKRGYVTTAISQLGVPSANVPEKKLRLYKRVIDRRLHPHMFRHTFATQMLRRGMLVDALSAYLGHSSVSITLDLYCHNEATDEELFEYIAEVVVD